VASEHFLAVVYFVEDTPAGWDGSTVRVVGPDSENEHAAVVRFSRPYASMFGPPNDEAFSGHPLSGRGLHPYSAFEVHHSSWIRALERMNAVHPLHRPDHFAAFRHFVLALHDTTFECVAQSYTHRVGAGPLTKLAAQEVSRISG
jgi:hypothetical protein